MIDPRMEKLADLMIVIQHAAGRKFRSTSRHGGGDGLPAHRPIAVPAVPFVQLNNPRIDRALALTHLKSSLKMLLSRDQAV